MNVREKLVELLQNAKAAMKSENLSCDIARNMFVVDFMMDHGVTVQEWISVKDRLPEIGRSVIAYNAPAKCAAEAMYKGEGMFLQFRWSARLQKHEVTHWMLMPEPPKGE